MNRSMKTIERRRLSDQIIDQILSSIARGKLKVGEKLPPEHILMKQFGVGRSSLREAMGTLSLMGVLSVRPGRGTHVTSLTDSSLEFPIRWKALKRQEKAGEFIEARIVLEQGIIGLAVEKANQADIDELKRRHLYLESVKKNIKKFIEADLSFHFTLVKVARNNVLTRFLSDLRQPMRTVMERSTSLVMGQNREITVKEHAAILEAIEAKDVEKAKLAIRQHLKK